MSLSHVLTEYKKAIRGRTLDVLKKVPEELCEHEGHHRGQVVTYLRLLGVAEPRPWGF